MLKTVADLAGHENIVGLAPSSAAARVLAKEAGIASRTLQWFLVRHQDLSDPVRLQRAREEYRGQILAVDEASMIGTVQMEELLRISRQIGVARVVLTGDTAQLKSITAGQPFGLLQKAGMTTVVMDEVMRQEDPDLKEAVARAREGEAREAITRLDNRVREHTREDLGSEAAVQWLALSTQDRERCAVLAPTHVMRQQINDTIRSGLAEEGVLHGNALTIVRLVPRRLTRQQAALTASYQVGDEVVFHRDAYGCRRDDICLVRQVEDDAIVLDHGDGGERRFRPSGNVARNLGVYETAAIEIRAGDRIRWTRNLKARTGRNPQPELVNGEEAVVKEIGPKRVHMETTDGQSFSLARAHPQLRHLDHAWSSTVHSAQGRTAPKVIAVLDAGGMAQSDLFYVEVSRASEGFTLLTDDREALIEALETSPDVSDSALEALGEDLDAAIVDLDEAAALLADWRAIEDEAERTGRLSSTVAGYDAVMARVASFAAIEDLPQDLRAFTDDRLAAHASAKAAEREVRKLINDISGHWRRWPELAWAAEARGGSDPDLPQLQPWVDRGARLLDAASRWLDEPPPVQGFEHATIAVEASAARLRRVMAKADAQAFRHRWKDMAPRLAGEAVLLRDDYRELATVGHRLVTADGLGEGDRRVIEAWQAFDERQRVLHDDVTRHPDAGVELLGGLAFDPETGAGPDDPEVPTWRRDADAWLEKARALLTSSDHAPYVEANPDSRGVMERTIRDMETALARLDRDQLLWRLNDLEARAETAGVLSCDVEGWTSLVDDVRNIPTGEDDGVLTELIRWVVRQDDVWRRERDVMVHAATALQDLEATRPVVGASDAHDWRRRAHVMPGLIATLPPRDTVAWRSHCRARGIDPDALARLIDGLPGWREAADACEELVDWRTRVTAWKDKAARWQPPVPSDRCHDLVHQAGGLMDEGRALPGLWESRGVTPDAMAGARVGIDRVIAGVEATVVRMETPVFTRLTETIERLPPSVHPLDDDDVAMLRESIGRLDGFEGLAPDLRQSLDMWKARIAGWEDERREVGRLAAEAVNLDNSRPHDGTADPADWLRRTRSLIDDTAMLETKTDRETLSRHIRAHGHDPDRVTRILESAPRWLEAAEAVREARRRSDHLARLPRVLGQVREAVTARTVRWDGTGPLLRGDRLSWHEDGARHDMIVRCVRIVSPGSTYNALDLEPLHGTGNLVSLGGDRFREIVVEGDCRRHLWPDETARTTEVARQYATPDPTFSIRCDDGVVAGDRIRWTLVRNPGLVDHAHLDGDTPQVEATVRKVSQSASWENAYVVLKVERTWGVENAPGIGEVIHQRGSDLAFRGCVRIPWEDESLRATRVKMAEVRTMDLSRGFSFRLPPRKTPED